MTRIQVLASSILATAMLASPPVLADCKHCGTVAEVKAIKKDEANDKSTAIAVEAGASYQVVVKMDNGKSRSFSFKKAPDYKAGDKVKVVNGAQLAKQ
jgi:uncharacterized Zn finger protein